MDFELIEKLTEKEISELYENIMYEDGDMTSKLYLEFTCNNGTRKYMTKGSGSSDCTRTTSRVGYCSKCYYYDCNFGDNLGSACGFPGTTCVIECR